MYVDCFYLWRSHTESGQVLSAVRQVHRNAAVPQPIKEGPDRNATKKEEKSLVTCISGKAHTKKNHTSFITQV